VVVVVMADLVALIELEDIEHARNRNASRKLPA
jgi:hypothetical protein